MGLEPREAAGLKISFDFCTQHPMWCPVPGKRTDSMAVTTHRSWLWAFPWELGACGPCLESWEDHCRHQQLPVLGPISQWPERRLARMLLTLSTLLPWSRGNPHWKMRVHRVDPKAASILSREQRTWQPWGFAGTAAQQDGHVKDRHETLLPTRGSRHQRLSLGLAGTDPSHLPRLKLHSGSRAGMTWLGLVPARRAGGAGAGGSRSAVASVPCGRDL